MRRGKRAWQRVGGGQTCMSLSANALRLLVKRCEDVVGWWGFDERRYCHCRWWRWCVGLMVEAVLWGRECKTVFEAMEEIVFEVLKEMVLGLMKRTSWVMIEHS
jgi:hypothetical protein